MVSSGQSSLDVGVALSCMGVALSCMSVQTSGFFCSCFRRLFIDVIPTTRKPTIDVIPTTSKPTIDVIPTTSNKEEGNLDVTPFKPIIKSSKSSLKKQWITRSRKRKGHHPHHYEDGPSVESTDTEEDIHSAQNSAVSSPAPYQSEMDPESLQTHKQWKKAIIIVWRHAAQHKYANLVMKHNRNL